VENIESVLKDLYKTIDKNLCVFDSSQADIKNQCLEYIKLYIDKVKGNVMGDIVEVIKCKNCKYYKVGNLNADYCYHERYKDMSQGVSYKPDDFCSYGKLKKNEEEVIYKIEIWRYHSIIETYESEEMIEILKWYKSKWRDSNEMGECTFYIYENNKEMTLEEIAKLGFFD